MTTATEVKVTSAPKIEVIDDRSRVIELRKPNILAQYYLVKMLGNDAANQTYLGMVAPLLYVYAINGEVANFSTPRQIDALIADLDEDGIRAVMKGIEEHFSGGGEVKPEEIKK